jgi:hypothetical protein
MYILKDKDIGNNYLFICKNNNYKLFLTYIGLDYNIYNQPLQKFILINGYKTIHMFYTETDLEKYNLQYLPLPSDIVNIIRLFVG